MHREVQIKHDLMTREQCWGKLLLKVMHYNIVLFPKIYFFMEVMHCVTMGYFFSSGLGLLVKKNPNKPQAE